MCVRSDEMGPECLGVFALYPAATSCAALELTIICGVSCKELVQRALLKDVGCSQGQHRPKGNACQSCASAERHGVFPLDLRHSEAEEDQAMES